MLKNIFVLFIFPLSLAMSFGCSNAPQNNQNLNTVVVSDVTPNNTNNQSKDKNYGILYGEGFSFGFKAPKGWVLDNESAKSEGIDAVFYPESQTWKNSPVMAYARSYAKDEVKTIEKLVEENIKGFHQNGSPNSKAVKVKTIKIDEQRIAKVYHYSGDQWGNFEATAYIEEENSINYFVLNARNKKDFDESLQAFEELVKTYKLIKDEGGLRKNDKGKNVY